MSKEKVRKYTVLTIDKPCRSKKLTDNNYTHIIRPQKVSFKVLPCVRLQGLVLSKGMLMMIVLLNYQYYHVAIKAKNNSDDLIITAPLVEHRYYACRKQESKRKETFS